MICKKCGKETNVVCLCGHCPECNGTSKMMNDELKKFIEEEKTKRTSNLVHQTSEKTRNTRSK